MKVRLFVLATLIAGALAHGAAAQTVGSAFPGVAPSVPSPSGGPGPPLIAPGPASPVAPGLAAPVVSGRVAASRKAYRGRPRIVEVPGTRPVIVPGGPANRQSYSDRVERCVHYGTAGGVSPGQIGRFTAQCAH